MLHLSHIVEQAGYAIGQYDDHSGADDNGAGDKIISFPGDQSQFAYDEQGREPHDPAAANAGSSATEYDQHQWCFSQGIEKVEFILQVTVLNRAEQVGIGEIDKPVDQPVNSDSAIGAYLSHFFPTQVEERDKTKQDGEVRNDHIEHG